MITPAYYSPVQTPVTTTTTSPVGVSQQPSPQLHSPVVGTQQDSPVSTVHQDSPGPQVSPVVATQQSSPAVATQQVSPVVETRSSSPVSDVSMIDSQLSTPEEDHVIMRGFQEVCQVSSSHTN